MSYCLDTNIFIQSMRHTYPQDIFKSFWRELEEWMLSGECFCPQDVYDEVNRKKDDVREWLDRFKDDNVIREADDSIMEYVGVIGEYVMKQYRDRLHQCEHFLDGADQWVIAHAKINGAKVVTQESIKKSKDKIRIPEVCQAMGVECINLVEMLREKNVIY